MKLSGVVSDGYGAAQRDVRNGTYAEHIGEMFHGTLNVEIGSTAWLADAPNPDVMAPHSDGYKLWLWAGHLDGREVWVMWPDRYPRETHVELLATVKLRDALDLSNGDMVTVVVP